MKATDFIARKKAGKKISIVTAYDYSMAKLVAASPVDCILVGDSAAMVMHGFGSTIPATPELMERHIAAVARGARDKFIIADMPFLSCRSGLPAAMDCVGRFMRAGANAVKIEGVIGCEEPITAIVRAGVPVMGHIGLTPQSIHQLGGYRTQGRGAKAASELVRQAKTLQELGCFALVAECVPSAAGQKLARAVSIPVIGIGAGPHTDGQVLVLHDMLGLYGDFTPKFAKRFAEAGRLVASALSDYDGEVKAGEFPGKEHSCD